MTQINNLKIYTDGGSRGNPGPAAIGVHAVKGQTFVEDLSPVSDPVADRSSPGVRSVNQKTIFQLSEHIGNTTNNVAEWQAAIKALEYLVVNQINPLQVDFYLDSELVVKQIKGQYKIKQSHLQSLALRLHQLLRQLSQSKISFYHIPREQNKLADALVNQALDRPSADIARH